MDRASVAEQHTITARRAARTLDALKRYRRLSDREIADAVGTTRSIVEQRRRCVTALDADDLERYARALDVEPFVLLMDHNEALRWVLEHRPNRAWNTAVDNRDKVAA